MCVLSSIILFITVKQPYIIVHSCIPRMQVMDSALANLQNIVSDLDAAPQTMIHNDCNPRNICLRRVAQTSTRHGTPTECPYEDQRCICIYDWELATINVPQHDVVEFLAFTLPPSTCLDKWLEVIDFYRKHLEYYSGVEYPLKRLVVDHFVLLSM